MKRKLNDVQAEELIDKSDIIILHDTLDGHESISISYINSGNYRDNYLVDSIFHSDGKVFTTIYDASELKHELESAKTKFAIIPKKKRDEVLDYIENNTANKFLHRYGPSKAPSSINEDVVTQKLFRKLDVIYAQMSDMINVVMENPKQASEQYNKARTNIYVLFTSVKDLINKQLEKKPTKQTPEPKEKQGEKNNG